MAAPTIEPVACRRPRPGPGPLPRVEPAPVPTAVGPAVAPAAPSSSRWWRALALGVVVVAVLRIRRGLRLVRPVRVGRSLIFGK